MLFNGSYYNSSDGTKEINYKDFYLSPIDYSASYGFEVKDKEGVSKYRTVSTACYGAFHNWHFGGELVGVYNGCKQAVDKTPIKDYWMYLIDPKESPFRSLFGEIKEYDFDRTDNCNWVKMSANNDTPLDLTISFFEAFRIGYDNPSGLRMWNELVKQGWDKTEALYISIYFGLDKRGATCFATSYATPWGSTFINDFKMLKNSSPKLGKMKVNGGANASYRGFPEIQSMWSKGTAYGITDVPAFKNLVDKFEYKGIFKSMFDKDHTMKVKAAQGKPAPLDLIIKKREDIFKVA